MSCETRLSDPAIGVEELHAETQRKRRGITLMEILIVISIISILAAAGVPIYNRTMKTAENVTAVADLKAINQQIELYYLQNGDFPLSLAEIGMDGKKDPWSKPYEYLNFSTVNGKGKYRKDHNLVPINSFYDLYSMGPDGKSQPPLTAKHSRDDIIMGRDGRYFGVATEY